MLRKAFFFLHTFLLFRLFSSYQKIPCNVTLTSSKCWDSKMYYDVYYYDPTNNSIQNTTIISYCSWNTEGKEITLSGNLPAAVNYASLNIFVNSSFFSERTDCSSNAPILNDSIYEELRSAQSCNITYISTGNVYCYKSKYSSSWNTWSPGTRAIISFKSNNGVIKEIPVTFVDEHGWKNFPGLLKTQTFCYFDGVIKDIFVDELGTNCTLLTQNSNFCYEKYYVSDRTCNHDLFRALGDYHRCWKLDGEYYYDFMILNLTCQINPIKSAFNAFYLEMKCVSPYNETVTEAYSFKIQQELFAKALILSNSLPKQINCSWAVS